MKSVKNTLFKLLFAFSLIILSLTSCEVGLGSAVDTDPPELVINSPEPASIIRDTFAIKGSWTDDRGVEKAYVTLKNTENERDKHVVRGSVSSDEDGKSGSWNIVVEKDTVPDGNYEAAVSIVDKAGHETRVVRQLVIDNTPPVIVLKRPSSRKGETNSEDIDGYGQLFTLKGLAADDSGVGLIEVSIYSDEALTQKMGDTITIKNVPNTISLDVAEFEEGIVNNYSAIYGSTSRSAGEQKRWCRVTAYDGAQLYPADGSQQSEEDKKGNASHTYYLYEDLSNTLLNVYKITDLYAMRNGSYGGGNASRSVINDTLSTLNNSEISAGVFTLNPANNPYYTVSGFQPLKMDGSDFGESMYHKNGNSLVISVKPGLDSYDLLPDTIRVYVQECNKYGDPTGSPIEIENITKEASGNTYTITAPIVKGNGISIARRYLLIVEGEDEKHNPIKAKGNGYGFYLDSNGIKPTLTVETPQSTALVSCKNNGEDSTTQTIVISGHVNFPSEICESGYVIIQDADDASLKWTAATIATTDSSQGWSQTIELKKGKTNAADSNGIKYLPDGIHHLVVYAVAGTDPTAIDNGVSVERNFKIDTKAPKAPELKKIENENYNSSKWYVEQNLQAELTASDPARDGYSSSLSKTEYCIGPTGADSDVWTALSATTHGYVNGLSEGTNTVKFRSIDIVGNITESAAYPIKVDTIAPIITKAWIGDKDDDALWAEITTGSIKNIKQSDKKYLKFEIEEANSLAASDVTVTYTDGATNGTLSGTPVLQSGKYIWTSAAEAEFTPDKTIQITITAKDATQINQGSEEYKVLVDTEGPVIEITTPEDNLEGSASLASYKPLKAGINDIAGNIAQTKYLLTQTSYSGPAFTGTNEDAANFDGVATTGWTELTSGKGNVNIPTNSSVLTPGKWYLYIYSKDEADNESWASRWFWFDQAAPLLGITESTKPSEKYKKQASQVISFSGTASDPDYASDSSTTGIEEVQYCTDYNKTTKTGSWVSPTSYTASSGAWFVSLNYGDGTELPDGNYVFAIRAKDKAGKYTTATYDVQIDTLPPVITISADNEWHRTLTLDISLTAEDATSKVNFVEYKTSESGSWTKFVYDEETETASGPVTFEGSGINKLYLRAKDKAGNESDSTYYVERKIDVDAPVLTAKYIKSGNASVGNFGGTAYENGTAAMTFWGEYSDSVSGVAGLTVKLGDNALTGTGVEIKYSAAELPASRDGTWPSDDSWVDISEANNKTIKSWRAVIQGGHLDTGIISIHGLDVAGNTVTAQQTTTLVHDENPPVIESKNISLKDNSTTTKAYLASAEDAEELIYYVNNSNGKSFTITGVTSDDSGVSVTSLKIGDNTYNNTKTTAASWSFTVSDLHTFASDYVTAIINSTDLAGNTSADKKIKLIFDVTPPAKTGTLTVDGNAYFSGMWGTSLSLAVAGNLIETGSGSSRVYYKRYATSTEAAADTGFISNYKATNASNDGSIAAPSSAYNGNINNLSEGDNYLLLVAEDNVGNPALVDTNPYYVRVDTKAPVIESTSGSTKFTNGSTPVVLTGKCADEGSGLDTVKVKVTIGSDNIEVPAELTARSAAEIAADPEGWTHTWTAEIPDTSLTGIEDGEKYDIEAVAKDHAGHPTTIPVVKLRGDINPPEATLNSVSPSVDAGNNSCYIRPDTAITVKGLSEDTHSTTIYTWLKLVPYTSAGVAGTAQELFEPSDTQHTGTTSRSWTLTIPANTLSSTTYSSAKLYVCTKDLAGNPREQELNNLVFDKAGPEYISTGSGSSFTATTVDCRAEASTNWYGSNNLIVTGTWKDLAGVNEVYYEIVKPGHTVTIEKTNATTFPSFTLTNKGSGFYAFNSEIRGFESGTNSLVMYAKDALGNISDISVSKTITVQVDTNAPGYSEFASGDFSEIKLTNGKVDQNITLKFYAKDGNNESNIDISSVPEIKLGTETLTAGTNVSAVYADEETAGLGYLVTVNLNETIFDNRTGYIPVIAVIKDKAGNTKEVNIKTVNVDSDKPTVTLNNPSDADADTAGIQVNKTISITGTANDKNLKARSLVKFQYKTENGSWTDLYTDFTSTNTNISYTDGTTDFTVKVDTTDETKFTDGQKYYIRAAVEDEAGNISWSTDDDTAPVEFTVNQDTDRPVITFMDIALPDPEEVSASDPVILKLTSKKLRLTVSDDDGVSSFTTKVGVSNLTNPSVKNGTWIYDLSQTDGTYTVEFEVTDAGQPSGSTYTSGTGDAPKFKGSSNSITDASISFKLMIDTTSPKLVENKYTYYTTSYPDTPVWTTSVPALGGTRNKLALQIKAGDENYIAGVTAKIGSSEYTGILDTVNGNHAKNAEDTSDQKWYSTWIIKDIDVSALAQGNHNLELTIKDGADNQRTQNIQLSVDRTPPEVDITNPVPTTNSSTWSSGSIQAYGSITGATKLKYALSPDGVNPPSGTAVTGWTDKQGGSGTCSGATLNPTYSEDIEFSANWTIAFDGNLSATSGVHDFRLNDYLIKYGITTQAKLDSDDDSVMFKNPVCLYLWLKAEDEVGNSTETPFEIVVNPQGSRPTIDINYPSNGLTLGKAVSIYGTHQDTIGDSADTIGVKSVWIQLISKAHGPDTTINLTNHLEYDPATYAITKFVMTKDDLDYMADNGYEVYNMKTYDPAGTNAKWEKGISSVAAGYTADNYAALANISGAAWNITINSEDELNPNDDSTEGQNPVGIRVFAKDGDGKLNTIKAERLVLFDSDTPLIKDLQLVEYDSSDNEIAVRSYIPDMYISSRNGSSWKLKGNAWDDNTITKLKINGTEQSITGTSSTDGFTCPFTSNLDTGSENDVGTISFKIEATDNSGHTGTENISIRFDNKKPELITSGSDYNIATIIRQSDGFYKFGSKAKEDPVTVGEVTTTQSGFAYTAFYFMRGTKLYDILNAKADSKITDTASSLHYEDNLYWYTKTLTVRSNAVNALTVSDASGVTGIHINSLVKIGGAYYKVTEINESTKTFKIDETDGVPPKDETTAYVAVAGLIDDTKQEKAKNSALAKAADGYYTAGNLDNDDGDRMLEFVYKSGTTWEWSANVCSKNIKDGPVKLVYVVFDAAGNYEAKTVDCIIGNNTPRLAGFSLYTDYNNDGVVNSDKDGKYEAYLSSTYSAESETGTTGSGDNIKKVYDPDGKNSRQEKKPLKNEITAGSAGSPVMTLRGKTVIIPEIVGGNDDVFYDYTINGHSGTNETKLFTASTDYTINSKEINIQLGDLVDFGDTACTEFKFTFRDQIDERTALLANDNFTDAQKKEINAYLSVYLGIAASATEAPVVEINPFYWKGLNENSVYDSENASSYKDLKGHIELEDDWKASAYYTNLSPKPSNGQYDADPKVSGQIVVTGSVHDDSLIKTLGITYGSLITNPALASFNTSTGALTSNAVKTAYGTNGYWFEITEEKFTASGHDVKWALYLNTEKWGVAEDAALAMTATNYGTPARETGGTNAAYTSINGSTIYKANPSYSDPQSNTPGSVQTSKNAKKAYYRMDIVPYVTDVKTYLSSANVGNHSVYSRTALGHYPVYMTRETGSGTYTYESGIKVFGFNLNGGTITFENGTGTKTASLTPVAANADEGAHYTFTLPSGAKKGNATVSVGTNSIKTMNNLNNDDSHGDFAVSGSIPLNGDYDTYSNYYNRMPNNENNNKLTDNLYFDVWDFNAQAAEAYGSGTIENLVMKVSPASGMLGFAFSSGAERVSMAGNNVEDGEEYSYLEWDRSFDYMQSTSLAYDSKGHTYGTAAGGDINLQKKWDCLSFLTDRWSQPILGKGQYGNASVNKESNVIKQIEGIGQKGDASSPSGNSQNIRKDRFQSICYATHRNKDDDGTYIYLAYYDFLNDEIRFKAGELTDTDAADEKYIHNYPGVGYDRGKPHSDFGNFTKSFDQTTYAANAALCQIVATNTAGNGTYGQDKTLGSVGNAVAIGVTSDNIVVMAWFDGTDLKYSYNNAFAGIYAGTDDTAFNDKVKQATRVKASKEGWSPVKTLITEAGQYCQLAVGGDDSIHVVAYDEVNANLTYAYLPGYNEDSVSCVVDSYLDTGTRLSLDVAAETVNGTTRYIPHIGYWAAYPEKPRYAYLADPDAFLAATDDKDRAGALSDQFTGIWECGVVPSHSTVNEGKVNVGLWKAKVGTVEGSRVASNYGTFASGSSSVGTKTNAGNNNAKTQTYGKCYGNTTDNAVLAYVIEKASSCNYVETAQMR